MSVARANNDSALYGASQVAYRTDRELSMAELTAEQVQALIRAGFAIEEILRSEGWVAMLLRA